MVFEFKTKSAEVKALLSVPQVLPNVVVSWSLNPRQVVETEEHCTPPLGKRLSALERIARKGYRVGIHFDPLILFPGWQEAYDDLVRLIRARVDPRQIAWWSLGALRFPPELMEILLARPTTLLRTELVPGFDGKFRYFKPRRLELFARLAKTIRGNFGNDLPLYLCMEDGEAWREVLPGVPFATADINRMLYQAALRGG